MLIISPDLMSGFAYIHLMTLFIKTAMFGLPSNADFHMAAMPRVGPRISCTHQFSAILWPRNVHSSTFAHLSSSSGGSSTPLMATSRVATPVTPMCIMSSMSASWMLVEVCRLPRSRSAQVILVCLPLTILYRPGISPVESFKKSSSR